MSGIASHEGGIEKPFYGWPEFSLFGLALAK